MTFDLGLVIFILISIFGLGLLVYFKDPKNKTNRLFAVMVFSIIIWVASNFLENETSDLKLATLFLRIDFSSASFIFYFWLLFCLNFPQPDKALSKIKNILIFTPAIIFAVLSFSDLIIQNIKFDTDGINFGFGKLYPFYVVYIFGYMIIGLYKGLILKYNRSQGLQKTQILYVLLGLLLTGSIAVVINLFFQQILPVELFRIGIYGVIFLVGFAAYAIIKKELFGIKVVLTALFVGLIAFLLLLDALLFTEKLSFQIIKGGILIAFIFFGYLLVRSVLREIKYREEIKRAYEVEKEAKKKIEELNRAKTRFMSITSHQLRAPLTVIKGYISMILEGTYGKMNGKMKEKLERVFQSNERLVKLVSDLLNVSRIEEGRIEMKFAKLNLEDLIADLAKELSIKIQEKGIYLKLEKPKEKLPEISADKDKINEVILNILDNAIKYTPKGGITVKIQKLKSLFTEEVDKIQIIISDTGEGMIPEEIDNLFKSFSRGEAGTSSYPEGMGLGLYIAKLFVELHHGKIWAESEGKSKGSTFYIELPVG